jgi:hypothetical protein
MKVWGEGGGHGFYLTLKCSIAFHVKVEVHTYFSLDKTDCRFKCEQKGEREDMCSIIS